MAKMTIQDISKVLMERNGLNKKVAAAFVNAMFDVIQQALERDRIVKVKGLGTFKIIDVDDRESVNVNTGERVLIEGHDKITFVPDALMKELVNKPFSQFETVVLKDGVDFDSVETPQDQEMSDDNAESSMPLVEFGDSINIKPVILGIIKDQPVEKPAPKPMPEPVKEPVTEPMAESPVVEESAIEDPVTEEPVVDKPVGGEPTEAETPIEDEAPVEEDTSEGEPFSWEEEESSSKKWLIALIAGLVGLIGGYFLGSYYPLSNFLSQEKVKIEQPVVAPELPDTLEEVQEPVDTTTAVVTSEIPNAEPSQPVEVKQTPQQDDDTDKYAAMDVRVRTGAYKIVGTDHIVKVKEGENLVKIARRVLGPDMECYLEVYNGLKASSELKVGQEIKIPKLQLKKKKKPQTVNE
ncbi:MAG: HU family DNA-binding protein [Prevotella sp.]|nr:HU family DNA-binding protein [Prevotella sp.]